MADINPTDCAERYPNDEDTKSERVALAYLLEQHPAQLTIPELSRALHANPGFGGEDAVERAVRELVGAGLLHCCGSFVLATRAALYFHHLEQD